MNGGLVCNLEQALPLFRSERSPKSDIAVDLVNDCLARVAICAVSGVNLGMAQPDSHLAQWPPFSARVHRHRDGRARAKRGEQKFVRPRTGTHPARRDRFIGRELVRTGKNLLRECDSIAVNDDFCVEVLGVVV